MYCAFLSVSIDEITPDGVNMDINIPLRFIQYFKIQRNPKPEKMHHFFQQLQPTTMGKKVNVLYSLKVHVDFNNTMAFGIKTLTHVFLAPPNVDEEEFVPQIQGKIYEIKVK